jgi:hypothetical protein
LDEQLQHWAMRSYGCLVQQELDITLDDKPVALSDKDWEKINRRACDTIRLYLAKDQKYFVWASSSVFGSIGIFGGSLG